MNLQLLGRIPLQKVGKFFLFGFLEFLAPGLKILEGLQKRFRHLFMGLFRPANNGEFLGTGEAFVAIVVIESDS